MGAKKWTGEDIMEWLGVAASEEMLEFINDKWDDECGQALWNLVQAYRLFAWERGDEDAIQPDGGRWV